MLLISGSSYIGPRAAARAPSVVVVTCLGPDSGQTVTHGQVLLPCQGGNVSADAIINQDGNTPSERAAGGGPHCVSQTAGARGRGNREGILRKPGTQPRTLLDASVTWT